ncbi:hypothetical protein B0H34DRAFT_98321 [Crassisporium funariophilum]|nr:hypothetical protein B0H34DRAFT_98321 [Crassisporium funariophilum]
MFALHYQRFYLSSMVLSGLILDLGSSTPQLYYAMNPNTIGSHDKRISYSDSWIRLFPPSVWTTAGGANASIGFSGTAVTVNGWTSIPTKLFPKLSNNTVVKARFQIGNTSFTCDKNITMTSGESNSTPIFVWQSPSSKPSSYTLTITNIGNNSLLALDYVQIAQGDASTPNPSRNSSTAKAPPPTQTDTTTGTSKSTSTQNTIPSTTVGHPTIAPHWAHLGAIVGGVSGGLVSIALVIFIFRLCLRMLNTRRGLLPSAVPNGTEYCGVLPLHINSCILSSRVGAAGTSFGSSESHLADLIKRGTPSCEHSFVSGIFFPSRARNNRADVLGTTTQNSGENTQAPTCKIVMTFPMKQRVTRFLSVPSKMGWS